MYEEVFDFLKASLPPHYLCKEGTESLPNDNIPEHLVVLCVSLLHEGLIAISNHPVKEEEVDCSHYKGPWNCKSPLPS